MTASHAAVRLYRSHLKVVGYALTILAVLISNRSWADDTTNTSPATVAESDAVPQTIKLGDVAQIYVNKSFRLKDTNSSAEYLTQTLNPIPEGVLGILAHNWYPWFAVADYSEIGFVKSLDPRKIDPKNILEAMRRKMARQAALTGVQIQALEWHRLPSYDPNFHTLSWSFVVATPRATALNNVMIVFGRKGYIELTAIQPADAGRDLVSMEWLSKMLAFNEGLRYEDHQNGDAVAQTSIPQLIVNSQSQDDYVVAGSGSFLNSWIFKAIASCLGLAAVVAAVILGRRVVKQLREEAAIRSHGYAYTTNGVHAHNGNGRHPVADTVARTNGKGRPGMKRRGSFDYSKFYVDFMMSGTNATGSGLVNEVSIIALQDISAPQSAAVTPVVEPVQKPMISADDLEMVERLRILIEEQKRLLHQQTRLIEEKNKFIEEQNEFLERQSALVKDHFSVKME